MDRKEISRRILDFTLEIIYLLSGEDYTVVKKKSMDCVTPIIHFHDSRGLPPHPITEPPPHSLIHEQKILEITHKMIELLTGEVPIRCQDVAVYFSMEEWEYIEGHEDRYKDAMKEDHQPFTSPDGSRRRNPPKRCPRPLYSQVCPEEKLPENHQDENLIDIKAEVKVEAEEETGLWGDQQYVLIERNPPERCPRPLYSQDFPEEKFPENHKVDGAEPYTHLYKGVIERNPPERCPRPLYSQDCPEEKLPQNHQVDGADVKAEVKDEAEEETDLWGDQHYGSRWRNASERCPRALYSQDCPEEKLPENHQVRNQGEDLTDIKVEDEEELMMGDPLFKSEVEEDILVNVTTENPSKNVMLSLNYKVEDEDIVQLSSGENPFTCNVYPGPHSSDLSHNPPNHEEPSDQSQIVTTSTGQNVGEKFQCGKRYSYSSGLSAHRSIHTGEKTYSCSQCEKYFTDQSNLITYERLNTGEKLYSCMECVKSVMLESDLAKHDTIHTGEKPFLCYQCGKYFTSKFKLGDHQRYHTGEKPYPCSECGKCFIVKSDLVIHQRIHTGEKPYSCSVCGKCFITKAKLKDHQRIHTGEKPYSCTECGKCFTTKSNLVKHKRIHTGEKPYSCSVCGKCFITNAKLGDHQRIHTGEKPYSCTECGKCFIYKSNLITHERIHTGERPYSCLVCGKCFVNKSNLVTHERVHRGEKPYSCTECGKSYTKKSNLVKHERIHAGEKPYSCSECGKCFINKSHLAIHESIHTG